MLEILMRAIDAAVRWLVAIRDWLQRLDDLLSRRPFWMPTAGW